MRKLFTGDRIGRLALVRRVVVNDRTKPYWVCYCSCGTRKVVSADALKQGFTRSCGCLRREVTAGRQVTHGLTQTRTYRIWAHMRSRCYDPNYDRFPYYGGRGISVCDRWSSFENFYADMGEAPAGKSIDRIDNSGNYEPSNCRWATQSEQTRNTRANVYLTVNGKTQPIVAWAEETGLKAGTIQWRKAHGRTDAECLAPVN